jgi:hypothetical protein
VSHRHRPKARRSAAPNSADRQRWGRSTGRRNGTTDRLDRAVARELQSQRGRCARLIQRLNRDCRSGTPT